MHNRILRGITSFVESRVVELGVKERMLKAKIGIFETK